MARKKLSGEEIENFLKTINGWQKADGKLLKRFTFSNFADALALVNQVGEIAEKLDHHPDICFGWGYAEFAITTHDAGGITAKDFELAKAIENLLS